MRYLWGKLRIFLLDLGIFPKIMAGLGIQIQLPSKIEKIFPPFFSTNQLLPRIGSAPPKGHQSVIALPKRRKTSVGVITLPQKGGQSVITLHGHV